MWSNGSWRLQVRAAGPNFVQTPTGAGTIPVGRLRVAGTTAAPSRPPTSDRVRQPTTMLGRSVNINYRLTLLWSEPADVPAPRTARRSVYTAVTP